MKNNMTNEKMRISPRADRDYPWLARFIFWAQKKKYGESLFPSRLWGRSPSLLYGLQVFYRCIDRKGSPLEPALRALINVRVSQINHCEFCVDISSSLLQKRGVSNEKIIDLQNYENSALFTERERSAIAFAEAMTFSDKSVNAVVFDRLKNHFTEDAIVELTALIGYQNLSSKFNSALAVPIQGFCFMPAQPSDTAIKNRT